MKKFFFGLNCVDCRMHPVKTPKASLYPYFTIRIQVLNTVTLEVTNLSFDSNTRIILKCAFQIYRCLLRFIRLSQLYLKLENNLVPYKKLKIKNVVME